ncbi:hypothetical protein TREMEDRAFT_34882 [Tremella mesenterica DSM 1558]|uniref:uncharacterized protein n=1 Tax=Tremella mesenterica (strain ATCC 24925 / CBS 8224 / DSM 1558 / NBRC 9311 / NRRL Y-6157 / RJB 2259-6 / UBC 559-6) TaxID=578456 RepID=UPI00032C0B5D|nr:uncharacterized protein TREMEDRAFT_34882 [Tremella mesenterica DSM 1558]EIW66528.1 hypothetical protein TREMEDRAFT_34882 [Tremella mesenterica DSM 1558]
MPSFTRRIPPSTPAPAGTHPSPSTSLPLISTGLPALDDLLGGGLPLSSILLVLSPDPHSSWGKLVSRYFLAQGLSTGQNVSVISGEEEGKELVKGCMWKVNEGSESEGEGIEDVDMGERGKIAWRYHSMNKFETTISTSNHLSLMHTIPSTTIQKMEAGNQLRYLPLTSQTDHISSSNKSGRGILEHVLLSLHDDIKKNGRKDQVGRYVLHDFGSADWGNLTADQIHRFLHSLRSLLKGTNSSAIITLPPWLVTSPPSDLERTEWVNSLSWSVDACIELRGFGDDPTLPILFPQSHGTFHLHSFPTSHTLLPPTLRHSSLLGISTTTSSASGGGGAGENNLSFRLKRKAFVIERMHLGVEGGIGERRTAPPPDSRADLPTEGVESSISGTNPHSHDIPTSSQVTNPSKEPNVSSTSISISTGQSGTNIPRGPKEKEKRVKVRFGEEEEIPIIEVSIGHDSQDEHRHEHKESLKQKQSIRHDRMDLYEF